MFEQNRETKKKNLRVRRLYRRFFLFIKRHLLWLILGLVVLWAGGLFFVAPIARARISEFCGGEVYIQSGRLKGFGGVRLKGVVIAPDRNALAADIPILKSNEVEIRFDPWKLLRGKFEVSSILLKDFLVNADYDVQADQWNFQRLSFRGSSDADMKVPLVDVRGGALRVRRKKDGQSPEIITQVSLNGQTTVQSDIHEYHFSFATDGRFGFGGSTLQGRLKMGGPGQKNLFFAEGKIQMPQTTVFDNAWNLNDVQLQFEFDEREIVLNRCRFSMGQGQADLRGTISEDMRGHRELNVDLNIERLRLSDHYEKNAVVYSEPVLERLDPGFKKFLTQYHPTGIGDIKLLIKGNLDDLSTTELNGVIFCRDVSVYDNKFPYLLEHLQGPIEFSGRNLKLDQLAARHGEVELLIDGSIKNIGSKAEIDLRTTSSNMQFDPDLYKALNEKLKRVWYSFSPQGTTGIDYHFQRHSDGTKAMSLKLDLIDAGLIYERFPYPLEHLTGMVIMETDRVELKELVAHYDDMRKVTLNGQVLEIGSEKPRYRIFVNAKQIPVDELLVYAMPRSQRAFFERLTLSAVADVDVEVFPNVVGKRPVDYIAKVLLDGDYLLYKGFPLAMEQVHLKADITQDDVLLREFEAHTGGGHVRMSGKLSPNVIDPLRPGVCLDINLAQFDLNEAFWNAAGQDAKDILGKLQVRGRTDIQGKLALNITTELCPSTDLVIRCFQNPFVWDADKIGIADGTLHVKADTVLFDGFSLNGILLESLPEELLKGGLQTIYRGIEPRGVIDLDLDKGAARMGPGGLERMDVTGSITCKDVAGGHTGVVTDIDGVIQGTLKVDRDKNIWQTTADYKLDRFKYRDWLISDLDGKLVYDPNTTLLHSREFAGYLYGGKIAGSLEIELSNEKQTPYRLGLSIDAVEVGRLLAGERTDEPDHVTQGLAYGALNVEGILQSTHEANGNISSHVINMKLGQQSVLGKILTAMQFKRADDFVFSEVDFKALIRGSKLIFDDVRMAGKPLVFRGTGELDWERKQIQMDLVAFDRLMGKEDTILDLLTRGIGSAIWKVQIRGDLNSPQVDAVYLSVLKQPLDIFKKKN